MEFDDAWSVLCMPLILLILFCRHARLMECRMIATLCCDSMVVLQSLRS